MRWRTFALVVAGAFIGGVSGGWLASGRRELIADRDDWRKIAQQHRWKVDQLIACSRPVMPRRTADLPHAARPKPLVRRRLDPWEPFDPDEADLPVRSRP